MKKCPYCGAENQDQDRQCYRCGLNLETWTYAPAVDAEPTQPVHPPPSQTQPRPAQQPRYIPQTYSQQPQDTQPTWPAQQQPMPYPPSTAPYYPPPNQPASAPPVPPGYPPAQPGQGNAGPSHFMPVLAIGLALLLLFVCGLSVWTITAATTNGVSHLGAQVSTQVANVFNIPAANPTATEMAEFPTPTPWPTFTPAPTATSTTVPTATIAAPPTQAPTETGATPNSTQEPAVEKLLSPECSSAVNQLGEVSNQFTKQPLQVFDATWRQNFNQALSGMKTNCGSLDTASPVPGRVAEVQHNLSQASSEFDQANKLWTEGIDGRDPNKVVQAGQHMQQAISYLNQAITGLKQVVP